MKRDMELVKEILEALQIGEALMAHSPVQLYGALGEASADRQKVIGDHIDLMCEAGFVAEENGDNLRLIWKGYNLWDDLIRPRPVPIPPYYRERKPSGRP